MSRKAVIVMVCGCLILLLGMGTRQSMGLFLGPISMELMLDTQVFALSIGIQQLVVGLSQPVVGALGDRFGTGRMIAICGVLYSAGLLLISGAATPLGLHAGAGVLMGMGSAGTGYALILGAVGRAAAPEKRTLLISIVSAFGSLGQLIAAPTNQALITHYGAFTTLFILAIAVGAMVPLSVALAGRASDTHDPITEGQTLRQAVSEAFAHRSFVLLFTGYFVCGFQVQFVGAHLPNYLTINGLGHMAGLAIGLIGFFNFIGTLCFGLWAQKYSKKKLLAIIYAMRSVCFVVFLAMPLTEWSLMLFSLWLGFLWLGTVPLTTGLVGQMFGVRYLSTLGALVFFSHQLGSFTGTYIGGVLFDATGSYDVMWYWVIAMGVFAALVHLPIDERRAQRPATAAAPA